MTDPVDGHHDAFVTRFNATGDNITYSTYLGGSDEDFGHGIAVELGCAYVTGDTYSADFPTLSEYMTDPGDSAGDAFVTKIDTTQSGTPSLRYSTYLGGGYDDYGHGIAVDSGYAYVTGDTLSADFPTKNQYQTDPDPSADAFVTKLDTSQSGLNSLICSSYLGGNSNDYGFGIAIEPGSVYVTGGTNSTDFPTLNQYQGDQIGWDAFVAKFEVSDIPAVVGDYYTKGRIKFYDWRCNRWIVVKGGTLHITEQDKHKVEGYWQPEVALEWSDNISVKGYVGPLHRDAKLKIKNTPRLSLLLELGDYCQYPSDTYVTYILNAKIKIDKKTELVKSIKGTINGWGEWGTPFSDNSSSLGQFEGKFTATPLPSGVPVPQGSMEYAPSAMSMSEPSAPAGLVPAAAVAPMVAAGGAHTVGLEPNGTVVAVGYDDYGQVSGVSTWTGIAQVAAGDGITVGLKADGTVVAAGYNNDGQVSGVSTWTNITQVSAGGFHTVGLESDGTVVAAGLNSSGQCSGVSTWTNITQVDAGSYYTVGLRSDGTVVAVGDDTFGKCSGVSTWTNIIQVAAGGEHIVGLKADGTVVAVGRNDYDECDIAGWNLAATPDVAGDYPVKGSVKFYDWRCNKWLEVKGGTLHITDQDEQKIEGYWEPDVAIEGWSDNISVKGYVGPFFRDAKKKKIIKNTPRLSLIAELGTYCTYPSDTYATYILNAKVKWDTKTNAVKSIKCTINGWGEWGSAFEDSSPSQGQFEGRFTATPPPAP